MKWYTAVLMKESIVFPEGAEYCGMIPQQHMVTAKKSICVKYSEL